MPSLTSYNPSTNLTTVGSWLHSLPTNYSSMADQNSQPTSILSDGVDSIAIGSSVSYSTAPVNLPIIGKNTKCYQYTPEKADLFIDWWQTTKWYSEEPKWRKKMHWGSNDRLSDIWKSAIEGATIHDGRPMIICTRCDHALVHPSSKNTGNKAMQNHLMTAVCTSAASFRGFKQLEIYDTIPEQVDIIFIC